MKFLILLLFVTVCQAEERYQEIRIEGQSNTVNMNRSISIQDGSIQQSVSSQVTTNGSTQLLPTNPVIAGSAILLKTDKKIKDKTIPKLGDITRKVR